MIGKIEDYDIALALRAWSESKEHQPLILMLKLEDPFIILNQKINLKDSY